MIYDKRSHLKTHHASKRVIVALKLDCDAGLVQFARILDFGCDEHQYK